MPRFKPGIQYSRGLSISATVSGVLDRPVKPGDDRGKLFEWCNLNTTPMSFPTSELRGATRAYRASSRRNVAWAKALLRRAHRGSASIMPEGGHASLCPPYNPHSDEVS